MIDMCQDMLGQEVSEGRYRILAKLGEGSMGQVYLAFDNHLQTDVVIKFPARGETIRDENHLLQRFEREIRSLVKLSHPHIVKIIDVGRLGGSPFVVLQYLSGGTLMDRLESGPRGEPRPLPDSTLHDWLPDVSKALDFIHFQGHIHRDVKPANIFFDSHGNAFLGDFGIIKVLKAERGVEGWQHSSLTAPGFLLGTPNYVAPEIVMGYSGDGRSDQYSLALTVYEVLTGCNIMAGPTASATLVNQTTIDPPLLDTLVPGIPRSLSETIRRGLSKDPELRFASCVAFAKEALAEVPLATQSFTASSTHDPAPDLLPCPTCRGPVSLSAAHPGEHLCCSRCQSISTVRHTSEGIRLLPVQNAAPTPPPKPVGPWSSGSGQVRVVPDIRDPAGKPVARDATPQSGGTTRNPSRRGTRRSLLLGALALLLLGSAAWFTLNRARFPFLSAALLGADQPEPDSDARLSARQTRDAKKPLWDLNTDDSAAGDSSRPAAASDSGPVAITIAYGSEKEKWLNQANDEFKKSPKGKRYIIALKKMGSNEAADAIINASTNPQAERIHVWAPASSVLLDNFRTRWQIVNANSEPIKDFQSLASTPVVFIMWRNKHIAFKRKYPEGVTFDSLAKAMSEQGGWEAIAGKREWGPVFRFGHTRPEKSNSGLVCLLLMAYHHGRKKEDLRSEDLGPQFQAWLDAFERNVMGSIANQDNSTGNMGEEMLKRGPKASSFDALFLYENALVEMLDEARIKYHNEGELDVIYPNPNYLNDHPYYILNVPWSQPSQQDAAREFRKFLLTEEMQELAIEHGFRPGNSSVPFDSLRLRGFQRNGLKLNLEDLQMLNPPDEGVVQDLMDIYQRITRRMAK